MKISDLIIAFTGVKYENEYEKYLDLEQEVQLKPLFEPKTIGVLNHIGIGYQSNNYPSLLQNLVDNKEFRLYEEESGDKNNHWLFMEPKDRSEVWFEQVINTGIPNEKWTNQIQVDFDTKMTHRQILDIYGEPDWSLNVPNHGVVLCMYLVGKCGGKNFFIGLGTDIRMTTAHRKSLKKLNYLSK